MKHNNLRILAMTLTIPARPTILESKWPQEPPRLQPRWPKGSAEGVKGPKCDRGHTKRGRRPKGDALGTGKRRGRYILIGNRDRVPPSNKARRPF